MKHVTKLSKHILPLLLITVCSNSVIAEVSVSARSLESLVSQWLKTEQQIDALEYEWQQQQEVLKQRLVLLEAEKDKLKAIQNQHKDSSSEADLRRKELTAQQTQLEGTQKFVAERIGNLEQELRKVHPLLPPPLASVWEKELAGMSHDIDLSSRLSVVLTLLDKLMDFEQRISVHEMSISNQDGKPIWVKQVYLGIHHAWFVSDDLSYAGSGSPHASGWTWKFEQSSMAKEIRNTVDIIERKRDADWVSLPMTLPLILATDLAPGKGENKSLNGDSL